MRAERSEWDEMEPITIITLGALGLGGYYLAKRNKQKSGETDDHPDLPRGESGLQVAGPPGSPEAIYEVTAYRAAFRLYDTQNATNQLVQTRIDGAIKEEAAAVLAAMGLTVSDAVRLLLTKVAQDKALPFEPLIPNATTIEAMKEARKGKLPRFATVNDLMADLHAAD